MPTPKKNAPKTKPPAPPAAAKKKPTIDPEIAKLRREYQKQVKAYQQSRASGDKLKRITDQLLPTMTVEDKRKLYEHLKFQIIELDESEKTPLPGMEEGGTLTEPVQPEGQEPVDPFLAAE